MNTYSVAYKKVRSYLQIMAICDGCLSQMEYLRGILHTSNIDQSKAFSEKLNEIVYALDNISVSCDGNVEEYLESDEFKKENEQER